MYYYIYENGNIVGVGYSESESSSLVQITKEEYDTYIAACKDHNRRLKQFLESNDNSSIPQEFLDEVIQIKNQQNQEILPGQEGTKVDLWEQPDSTNPYKIGDKVLYNEQTWVCTINNNVWTPGVYGWEISE